MILFPAIDLKDGKCVRLKLGDMDAATVFSDDPGAQARKFQDQGFSYLHIVDLNGAFAGKPVNGDAVDAILEAITIPAQLGGGIRDMETIEEWIDSGIARVILGTVAVRDPELVRRACVEYPGRIAVGIDAKGGKVAVEGWAETSELTAEELAKRFEDAGVSAIIYTDIERDGILKGLNLEATAKLARSTSIPGHRLGRPCLDRRREGPAQTRVCYARGRHHRPRAVRRPHRPARSPRPASEISHERPANLFRARPGAVRRHSDRPGCVSTVGRQPAATNPATIRAFQWAGDPHRDQRHTTAHSSYARTLPCELMRQIGS